MTKTKSALLSLFLLLGLFTSGIGVTWCHYQVSETFPIQYYTKTAGQFEITDDDKQWILDPTTQIYSNEFTVINKNTQTNHLNIHLNTTQKATYSMILIEPSGREVKYDSLLIQDTPLNYHYKFIDKEGNEAKIKLEGNQAVSQQIRLEATDITDSFLSEIILVDDSYEVETATQNTTSQYQELIVSSNYLSSSETFNILLEQDTIDITLDSNMTINSKLTTNDEQVTFNVTDNKYKELNLTLNSNETQTVTLDVTNITTDTVTVTWEIYDNENVIQTLKANFIIKQEKGNLIDILPNIEMNYVNDISHFNKYEPIKFTLKSDIDTNVQIGDIYPVNTYYSLDNGNSWYVTTCEDVIDISLTSNTPTTMIIDLSKTDIVWEDIQYDVYTYQGEYLIQPLTFNMQLIEIEELEIIESNMGIINDNELSFTLNTEDVMITIEQYNEGQYIELNESYFTLASEDNLTYTLTTNDVDLPKGIYKIKIQQYYNETLIKEESLSFFTIQQEVSS